MIRLEDRDMKYGIIPILHSKLLILLGNDYMDLSFHETVIKPLASIFFIIVPVDSSTGGFSWPNHNNLILLFIGYCSLKHFCSAGVIISIRYYHPENFIEFIAQINELVKENNSYKIR